MTPLYSVGTWDMDVQAYTPQEGIARSLNITRSELHVVMRQLRNMGYSVHRHRSSDGGHDSNDTSVLIERTDGMPETEILAQWQR